MIEPNNQQLSISRQCKMVGVSRSSYYYQPIPISQDELELMRKIDELYLQNPSSGSRTISRQLGRQGITANRKRVQRLMRLMGIEAVFPKPRTSQPHPQHKIYPYLLRGLSINRTNQVWATDITYIPMASGYMYLVAIMDWHSRKVLSWRLSNSMEADFCVEALSEAIAKYGKPEIMNSDQGSQFTGFDWIQALKDADIKISMDGRGRWIDNRMIERLWRSLKYECIYLNAFETGSLARTGIGKWLTYYNSERPHSTHGILTPDEAYERKIEPVRLAA